MKDTKRQSAEGAGPANQCGAALKGLCLVKVLGSSGRIPP